MFFDATQTVFFSNRLELKDRLKAQLESCDISDCLNWDITRPGCVGKNGVEMEVVPWRKQAKKGGKKSYKDGVLKPKCV